ncbi:MAG: hypothetical protein NC200_07130 [Candidatus Gastranaerophilales bacterium]|nr:hypothetical protein [Candidatus Gastranaerophilales bacterium]
MTEFNLEQRYKIFIHTLNKELERMFVNQAEFIKCKEGCSYCCERGEYPFSEIEFTYLMDGYRQLPESTKNKIKNNLKEINNLKKQCAEESFMYKCPFLIDKKCSVYNNRGIICRTFGLLCEHEDEHLTIPFCHELGLNYNSVYDKEIGQIVSEKDGIPLSKTEPKAYRISRKSIMKLSIARNLDIEWGESKTMLDLLNESEEMK